MSKAVLKMQINKSDRNDAAGIARIMQTGWFKEVRVKDLDSHSVRALRRSMRMVPHIFIRKSHQRARKFLIDSGKRLLQHGVIPGSCHTKAQGISSPGRHEAILMWPRNDGELRWNIMSDWTCR